MSQLACESCGRDTISSPDVERVGRIICLDCQSRILHGAATAVDQEREILANKTNRQYLDAEFLRECYERRGEPVPPQMLEFTNRIRAGRVEKELAERAIFPPTWAKFSLEQYMLFGFIFQVMVGFVVLGEMWASVVAFGWTLGFAWLADRIPRRFWASKVGWGLFLALLYFGGISIVLAIKASSPSTSAGLAP